MILFYYFLISNFSEIKIIRSDWGPEFQPPRSSALIFRLAALPLLSMIILLVLKIFQYFKHRLAINRYKIISIISFIIYSFLAIAEVVGNYPGLAPVADQNNYSNTDFYALSDIIRRAVRPGG